MAIRITELSWKGPLKVTGPTPLQQTRTATIRITVNHGIAQVGKDLQDHQVQAQPEPYYPNSNNPPLHHIPKHHIQMVFNRLQS